MSIKIGIGRIRIGWSSTPVVPVVQELEVTIDDSANASGMIGGDATSLTDWNTAFGSPASPFTSITVAGNVITLKGGSNITVPDSLFSTNFDEYGHLISIVDTGCIVAAGENSFGDYNISNYGNILNTAILPEMVTAGVGCFYSAVDNHTLQTVDFRSLVTAGSDCFRGSGLNDCNFSSLTTIGADCFYDCIYFITMSFPALTALGPTHGDDFVFGGIIGKTITLTIPSTLMTCDGGSPDGDIVYLTAPAQGNTVTIIQV